MKAIRVHEFGGVDKLVCEEVDTPAAGDGEVLVRVGAAGVGPWDAWVRSGTSAVPQRLPLTPGSDLAGIVERVGADTPFQPGDVVYGVTNPAFVGAYAEYAVASAAMLAHKPVGLIRFGGHLPKGGYDVRNGRVTEPATAPTLHG